MFAAAGGHYVEIELGGDPHYDSTGVTRVHGAAAAPLLGPSAGSALEDGGLAIGPTWALAGDAPGSRRSLASYSYADVTSVVRAL